MGEAINYSKVAVIINVDSLITLSQSASDSSMGRSMSYSVSDQNLYRLLINYMKVFPTVSQGKEKWMAIIAKNSELVKILKKDLGWPLSIEERKNIEEEKEMDRKKRCFRCQAYYS